MSKVPGYFFVILGVLSVWTNHHLTPDHGGHQLASILVITFGMFLILTSKKVNRSRCQ